MVTIQDVARAAGVSPMTVSNVINERPHVKESTRLKVLDTMSELGYRVNVAARNLRTGRTGTIGLAVPEINRPYYGQLAARIIALAEQHNVRVVLEQTGASRENELAALALSRNRLYDGLILSAVGLGSADREFLEVDYPVVILGERIFDGPVDHVAMPNVDAARAATRHLLDRGCRSILVIEGRLGADVDMSSLRVEGYRQALADAGVPYEPELVQSLEILSMQTGRDRIKELLDARMTFDGVFCVTDTVAIGVLRGLRDAGLRVPDDVRVIGFDNIEEGEFLSPSLSSVDPDHDLMARTALDLLMRRITGGDGNEPHEEFVSTFRVVARESTASRATGTRRSAGRGSQATTTAARGARRGRRG